MRDMNAYENAFWKLPFEAVQESFRRKHVLAWLEKEKRRRVLEVGCGRNPLFTDLPEDIACVVVEPAEGFASHARELAKERKNTSVLQGMTHDHTAALVDFQPDAVVMASLLHELEDPQGLLREINETCQNDTQVFINVPNANSLHRMLALAMGLIPSLTEKSQTQQTMQQFHTFDADSLRSLADRSGFSVMEEKTIFVKPFTHAQMQSLMDQGFLTQAMLEGFDRLCEQLPQIGSELVMVLKRKAL